MALLEDYYAKIDKGDLGAAVDLLAEDLEFSMILPLGESRGRGRGRMRAYLDGRPPVDRKHVVLRAAADRDLEFVHGEVTERGTTVTGYFVGTAHVNSAGLIDRYQVVFSADFGMVPGADTR